MKPIRADITLRIHADEIVVSVSDGAGDVSLHRTPRSRGVDVLKGAAGEVAVRPDGAGGSGEEAAEADRE